jgi:hypothetical protein
MTQVWKKLPTAGERTFVRMTGLAPMTEFVGRFKGLEDNKFGGKTAVLSHGGKETCIGASGNLKWQLEQVPVGATVKIVYKGKEKIKKGPMAGREANQFEVLVADDAAASLVKAASSVNAREIDGDVDEALAAYEAQKRAVDSDDLSDLF